jgi:hypothetical protein
MEHPVSIIVSKERAGDGDGDAPIPGSTGFLSCLRLEN